MLLQQGTKGCFSYVWSGKEGRIQRVWALHKRTLEVRTHRSSAPSVLAAWPMPMDRVQRTLQTVKMQLFRMLSRTTPSKSLSSGIIQFILFRLLKVEGSQRGSLSSGWQEAV